LFKRPITSQSPDIMSMSEPPPEVNALKGTSLLLVSKGLGNIRETASQVTIVEVVVDDIVDKCS